MQLTLAAITLDSLEFRWLNYYMHVRTIQLSGWMVLTGYN